MTDLVIVESPGKVKKLGALLGSGYRVMASVGHVRDLPGREMGIAPPDFEPAYVPTERGKDVLAKLRQAAKEANSVWLATDPDREGEAIAWHLADALGLKNAKRVTFTAITKAKVDAAMQSPREIDMARVRAQEARRVLDRMVGYRVSPVLSDRAGQALSAGRVQSPAVRLVVDREREIAAFKVTQHYGVELSFLGEGEQGEWKAAWNVKPHLAEGQEYLLDKTLAERVAEAFGHGDPRRGLVVQSFEDSEKGRPPAAPFTTSTLQQAASQRLKFKPKQTMSLAQGLYEAGHITYMRTDDPNIDADGIAQIQAYAGANALPLAPQPRRWKAKEGAQEGHEAIRPTDVNALEAGATAEQQALYKLIWQRAVASQLADATYAVRAVVLAGELDHDGQAIAHTFNASGRTLLKPGWLAVYAADEPEEDEDQEASNPIPELTQDQALTAKGGRLLVKQTKPPRRFTQATLVKELEKRGIGRPSTYAAILDNITGRSYVAEEAKGYLHPTPVGESVRDALVSRFQFVELDYTRNMEDRLDLLAEGQDDYRAMMAETWTALDEELTGLEAVEMPAAHPCPTCGQALRRRKGRTGFFWGCTAYPGCTTTLPDERGVPGKPKPKAATSGITCPKCGQAELARRQGTSKPKKRGIKPRPYDFYSCTGYPKCDATFSTGSDGLPVLQEATASAAE